MRTHQHVSFLHGVAIIGAVVVVGTVGLLMYVVENTSRDLSSVLLKQEQLKGLVNEGQQFIRLIDSQAADAPHSGPLLTAETTDRWRMTLKRIGQAPSPLLEDMLVGSIESLDRLDQHCRQMELGPLSRSPDTTRMEQLRTEASLYFQGVTRANQLAVGAVQARTSKLKRRRRLALLSAAILGVVYLAAIEHSRHWTARRLVSPVEKLAGATVQALTDGAFLPKFEQCGTQELDTLAEMLSSFVETLKRQVQERTAELECQKEQLEREVLVRHGAEEQLRHAAVHDQLTGLCNRALLLDRLDRCIERARRYPDHHYALLFMDIDRFKEINDSLGHTVGDEVLIQVARRLETELRKTDTVSRPESHTVARLGGDEFVILLEGIRDPSDATIVVERIQRLLSQELVLDKANVSITASIGVASSGLDYHNSADLLRDADIAMYQAKSKGSARHEVFSEQMLAEATGRAQLTNDLRQAVENGEFVLHYQPIICLGTGRLTGFEALVRWMHPERGLISPIDFISHAEETGLIIPLGGWVLEEACRQLRIWRDEFESDEPLSMSVNVSRCQVAAPSLVSEVERVLKTANIPGECLNLEITESTIISNLDTISDRLRQLRALDVQVHMDDFGTGYSSLSCLHQFPLDVLKIDREFMGSLNANRQFAAVVDTVVLLAHNLNMEVIVEGVETKDQLAQLVALDSDYGQGFLFSKPLTADDAGRLIAETPRWLQLEAA